MYLFTARVRLLSVSWTGGEWWSRALSAVRERARGLYARPGGRERVKRSACGHIWRGVVEALRLHRETALTPFFHVRRGGTQLYSLPSSSSASRGSAVYKTALAQSLASLFHAGPTARRAPRVSTKNIPLQAPSPTSMPSTLLAASLQCVLPLSLLPFFLLIFILFYYFSSERERI